MKKLCIPFISFFLLCSFGLALADNEKGSDMTVGQSVKEIVNSINEIIGSSIRLAGAKLKELQKELEKGGTSIQKQVEKSMVEGLQKMLAELRRLEKALKKNLAEREGLPKEKLNQYLKDRDNLVERVDRFRKRIERFAEEIGRECKSLKEPIRLKVQDILKEMEQAINRMEERLKRQRQIDETLST
ncbi:MAG: hypothetical protein HWN70_02910 [Desulfobacterales bacterium]|nr:hypothetical protein [Desulfobacterales bacterium]